MYTSLVGRGAVLIGLICGLLAVSLPFVSEGSSRYADDGTAAAFLCSPLASGITGSILFVDKGYHAMGMSVESLVG